MDKIFFEQLKLPSPKYNLEVGSGSHGEQIARILIGVEQILFSKKPGMVLVEGDTNTVLAGALAASKLHINIGHIEAGLRSYDRQMPEEINRILTDHCSDMLFAPTEKATKILLSEGIPGNKIFMTGNPIVDAVYQNMELSKYCSDILNKMHLKSKEYFLVTVHRQENADNPIRFAGILKGLQLLTEKFDLPVVYPIHPRSKKMLTEFRLSPGNIRMIDPLNYFDFLQLENHARLILTDSGGIQEEACILGVPCVILRDNTERPETVEVGASMLGGTTPQTIREYVQMMLKKNKGWSNPFGDGKSGERIVSKLNGGNNG
jgi:UDP-N-acetylglucosamine 2-epimerase (non-hydrolysing)